MIYTAKNVREFDAVVAQCLRMALVWMQTPRK